ncbi:MAG: DUF2933 domain-containing protein [Xanthomonadales bacterium]|nr:DUF2933 domain-containing protein [Xanthomonadales bacterium]
MNTHPHAHDHKPHRSNIVFWLFAAVAVYFLLVEHRQHVFGLLPYLLILLCPLMHMFHHGHGGHHRGGRKDETTDQGPSTDNRSDRDNDAQ